MIALVTVACFYLLEEGAGSSIAVIIIVMHVLYAT
jgi:hypothetical protein